MLEIVLYCVTVVAFEVALLSTDHLKAYLLA